jgi:hypothetical protein
MIETNASKLFELPSKHYQLNILGYSINEDIINPFLLFMVQEKNNFLTFPKLLLDCDEEFNIENKLLDIIPHTFIYHGVVCDLNNNYYAVVNIVNTDIDMNVYTNLNKVNQQNNYFVLATEIINYKKMYNYLFSKEIINLFMYNPSFYSLINKNTNYSYKLPDVAYKYINLDEENYYLNFENKKEKLFESCDEYYFFNKFMNDSLRHVTIVRYALFTGNIIYYENNDDLKLNDYEINKILENKKYKNIIIFYSNQNHNPDILAIDYNNFISLSCIRID